MSDTNHSINMAATVKVQGDPSLKNTGLLGDGSKVDRGIGRLRENESLRQETARIREMAKIQIDAAKEAAKIQLAAAKQLQKELLQAAGKNKGQRQAALEMAAPEIAQAQANLKGVNARARETRREAEDKIASQRLATDERRIREDAAAADLKAQRAKERREAVKDASQGRGTGAGPSTEELEAREAAKEKKAQKDRADRIRAVSAGVSAVGNGVSQGASFFNKLPGRELSNEAGVAGTQRRLLGELQRGDLRGIMELQQNGAALKSQFGGTALGYGGLAGQGIAGAAQVGGGLALMGTGAGAMAGGTMVASGVGDAVGAIGGAYVGDPLAGANRRFESAIMNNRLKDPMTQAAMDQMQSEAGMRVHGGYALGGKGRLQQAQGAAWDMSASEAVSAAASVRGRFTEAETFGGANTNRIDTNGRIKYLQDSQGLAQAQAQKLEEEAETQALAVDAATRRERAAALREQADTYGAAATAAKDNLRAKPTGGQGIFSASQDMGRRGMDASGVAGILGSLSSRGTGALEGRGKQAADAFAESVGQGLGKGLKDARLLQDVAATVSEIVVRGGGTVGAGVMAGATSRFLAGMGSDSTRADISDRAAAVQGFDNQTRSGLAQHYMAGGSGKLAARFGWNEFTRQRYMGLGASDVIAGEASGRMMDVVGGDKTRIPAIEQQWATDQFAAMPQLKGAKDEYDFRNRLATTPGAQDMDSKTLASYASLLWKFKDGGLTGGAGKPGDMNASLLPSGGDRDKPAEASLQTIYEVHARLVEQETLVIQGLSDAQSRLAAVLESISQQNSNTKMEQSGMYIVKVLHTYKDTDGQGRESATGE